MDNVILGENQAKCELLLGCQVESNLKWHAQVASLAAKLGKRLAGLQNIKFIAPLAVRKKVAEGVLTVSLFIVSLSLGDLKLVI